MPSEIKTTTAEALLGMLSLRPASGYELRQSISDSIGNFWSESFGQIYPTLKRLEDEELIAAREGERAGSKVFSLTESGWERVREWLAGAPRPSVPRNELLLKVFFGNLVAPEHVERHIAERRDALKSDLGRFEAIERALQKDHAGHPGLPFWLMTVRYGIHETQALLRWCDESLSAMQSLREEADVQEAVR